MSRAFVKDDSEQDDDLPQRPVSSRPNYVTRRGLGLLKERVRELTARRSALIARADDPGSRQERRLVERDLLYYDARLASVIIVDNSERPPEDVRLGAVVETADAEGKTRRFEIVGEDEADAQAGKLNWASPLADALLGKKPGDRAVWKREEGPLELKVVSVSYPK